MIEGVRTIIEPDVTYNPEQKPMYQSHLASEPRVPPEAEMFTGIPEQIVVKDAEIESAGTESVFTIKVMDLHVEFPHDIVSCLAQYTVVTVGTGIVKFLSVPILLLPQLPVYQQNEFPTPPDPEITIVPPVFEHRLLFDEESEPGLTGEIRTVTVLLTHTELLQPGICHLA